MNENKPKRRTLAFMPEQKLLSFLEKHLLLITLIFITAVGLILRYALRDYVSGDAYYYLLPWYNQMKEVGFQGLSQPVGDYNILYQFFIALFTYLPLEALHAYKLFSIVFDLLLAFLAMWIIYKNTDSHRGLKAVIAYAVVLLSPIVFLNSACWAQCDVVYAYFCVFSVYEMYKEKYLSSMILFGVAVTFKLQAIFILPFLLFYYIYSRRFTILYFLTIPAVMVVLSLPGIVMGRGVFEVFTIYFNQTSTYKQMTMNYPSFWSVFKGSRMDEHYDAFSTLAVLLTIGVLLVIMVFWMKKRVRLSLINVLSMTFLLSYTCVMFLPAMHERYGFIYEIFALLIAFWYYKTIPMLLLMYAVSLQTYGSFLFGFGMNLSQLAFVNAGVYAAYMIYLNRQMFKESKEASAKVVGERLSAK